MSGLGSAIASYTETIFELREDDIDVIQARIAERLDVSRPAVSEMVRRLEREGYVSVEGGRITLTDQGEEIATRAVRRHRLAERFLTDMLGLSWAEAHEQAGSWESAMTPRIEQALRERLDNPTTCPHGNPIPGSGYVAPNTTTLGEVEVGGSFEVTRIPEELEFTPGLLDFLEEAAMLPGASGEIVTRSPDGTVTVEVAGRTIGIGEFAANRIAVSAMTPA